MICERVLKMFEPNHSIDDENKASKNMAENDNGLSEREQNAASGDGKAGGAQDKAVTPYGLGQENSYGRYSQYNTYSPKPDESTWGGVPYRPYGSPQPRQSGPEDPEPKKGKRHTFRKVLVGVLACLVVSAGSIAGFVALVNNGTVKLQASSSSSTPAFTIVQSGSSSTPAKNAATTASELTKQQVAQKVLPSVVCIENYSATSQRTAGRGDQFGFGDEEEGGGDEGNTDNGEVSPTSEGSGIVATADGYIITNAHVVSGASKLKVVLYDGKTYSATLVGSDSITDLALVKIDATGLTAAEFGSSGDLQVADTVMAVGNPGGLEFNSSVTVGYVSALNREITSSDTGYTMKCIQTDAAINPGNSGGALVNMKGQVVGINSSKIVATGYEGLGFAIPINTAQPIISELKQYGYVKARAALGVSGQYIDSMTARFYGLTAGFYVYSISSQYVTAAGIQKGDVITKVDNKSVTSQSTLASAIAAKKPGDSVTLAVARATTGKTFTVTVKLLQATGKS